MNSACRLTILFMTEAGAAVADYLMALGVDPGLANTGIGAIAALPDGRVVSAGVEFIKTEKNKDKRFEHLRVSMDDARRLEEIHKGLTLAVDRIKPSVIGVETYTVFDSTDHTHLRDVAAAFVGFLGLTRGAKPSFNDAAAFAAVFADPSLFGKFLEHLVALSESTDAFRVARGRGDAAKTYGVYTLVLSIAFARGIPIYAFMPVDLKKIACGRAQASKTEVADGLKLRIEGLEDKMTEKGVAKSKQEHCYDSSGHALLALLEYQKWVKVKA